MWAIDGRRLLGLAAALLICLRAQAQAPVGLPPAKVVPRVDALPVPATQVPVDLEALARGFNAQAAPSAATGATEPRLIVFISLAMPDATLLRLIDQAARAGAQLMLRGLSEGSLPRTAARVQHLIGTRAVAVQIDPRAFDRYAVQRVPSFVLARADAEDPPCTNERCSRPDEHVVVAGDVSLDYALAQMRRSAPAFAQDAGRFLARLGR